MENTKKCFNCGRLFEKKVNCSKKDWAKRVKYCSRDCAKKTEFQKGQTPWNKDLKGYRTGENNNLWKGGMLSIECKSCGKEFQVDQHRKNTAKYCSRECQIIGSRKPENRKRMRDIHKLRVKNGLHNLYRGATKENKLIKKSSGYRLWRETVFQRDDYTCWICEIRGGVLHPHHLKAFSLYRKLRLVVSNGLTLCKFCHKTYTDFGKNKLLFREPSTINTNNFIELLK